MMLLVEFTRIVYDLFYYQNVEKVVKADMDKTFDSV